MSYVIYVCDTETTGLDPVENDIIEISFWRMSDEGPKTWQLRPLNPASMTDKALKINGHKRDDLLLKTAFGRETYKEPAEVVSEIEAWIMQDNATIQNRVLLGQNIGFDLKMMRELWTKTNTIHTFPFSNFTLDTIEITRFIDVCTGRRRSRYNLGSLVRDFGVTKSKAHRAEGDVKMTRELFMKQIEPVREFVAKIFESSYSDENSV